MISVIIPARNEHYLAKTVENIYKNFTGDFEVIIALDGGTLCEVPDESKYSNLTIFPTFNRKPMGIRNCINGAVAFSSGDYILKVDAHCAFDMGFDEKMLANMTTYGEVAVARRWTLDLDTWKPGPRAVDYYYLSCPWTYPRGTLMSQSCPWITKTESEWDSGSPVDILMCFQGSMWMMTREHWDWLGGLEIGQEVYAEHHEISMKTWLGGRRVVIFKDTWYAHPAKSVRGYRMDMDQVYRDHDHSARYWTTNQWKGQVHDYAWLIDKFWPLPTEHNRHRLEKYYWPENWKEEYCGYTQRNRV